MPRACALLAECNGPGVTPAFFAHNAYFCVDTYAHNAYISDMDSKELINQLRLEGFEQVSQKGSHVKMRHEDGRTVIIPHPVKDLPKGTLGNIKRQANIKNMG